MTDVSHLSLFTLIGLVVKMLRSVDMPETKICRTCGKEKSVGDFSGRPSGCTQLHCKTCAVLKSSRRNIERYRNDPVSRARQIIHSQNNRAKRLGFSGSLDIHSLTGTLINTACCCSRRLPNLNRGVGFSLDHRQPLSRGGTNALDNIAIACEPCNRAKGDLTEGEYRAWLHAVVDRLARLTPEDHP